MYFHHYRHCIIFISSSSIHHDVLFIHIFKIYKSSYRDQITWCRSKDGDWVVGTTVGNNKKGVHLRLLSMLLLLSLWLLLSWLLSCCCHCHCCCCCFCSCCTSKVKVSEILSPWQSVTGRCVHNSVHRLCHIVPQPWIFKEPRSWQGELHPRVSLSGNEREILRDWRKRMRRERERGDKKER